MLSVWLYSFLIIQLAISVYIRLIHVLLLIAILFLQFATITIIEQRMEGCQLYKKPLKDRLFY